MFSYVQSYYAMGLYSEDDLATLKNGGMITADEYNQLVGGDTTPDSQSTSQSETPSESSSQSTSESTSVSA